MPTDDRLNSYAEKRDFTRTPEPSGVSEEQHAEAKPLFVVQKHDARRLHYDFRLELGGVLKSWAIPKGPSTDPKDKRLAVPTEDHPLSYATFEGVIPQGQYGAGRVIVWDTGAWRNVTERDGEIVPAERAIEDGYLAFQLEGRKLRGGYALTRFRTGEEEAWLLVKKRDEYAEPGRDVTRERPESALTERTIEQVSQEE